MLFCAYFADVRFASQKIKTVKPDLASLKIKASKQAQTTNSNILLGGCTGLPSSVCLVDCAIDGFISDQISLSKGDALGF